MAVVTGSSMPEQRTGTATDATDGLFQIIFTIIGPSETSDSPESADVCIQHLHKEVLPSLLPGDVILLRGFFVRNYICYFCVEICSEY